MSGPGFDPSDLERPDGDEPDWRGVNVQSIADSTGIPRENVRRKAAALMDRGWVRRLDGGELCVTAKAGRELGPIAGEIRAALGG